MKLQNFVKANFLGGLLGTLVLSPFAYLFELIQAGAESKLLKIDLVDLLMLLIVPFIVAIVFAITAFAAFPIVKWLQRKGLIMLE
jgi:hypothetical protein